MRKPRKIQIIKNSKFVVTPSKSGKTGLVVNLKTGKSYRRSLKGLTIVKKDPSALYITPPAITVLNTEKKSASKGLKAMIKTMMSNITVKKIKFDTALKL